MYCAMHTARDPAASIQKLHVAHSNTRDNCSEPANLSTKNAAFKSMSRELTFEC